MCAVKLQRSGMRPACLLSDNVNVRTIDWHNF